MCHDEVGLCAQSKETILGSIVHTSGLKLMYVIIYRLKLENLHIDLL